jgi:hypothetical protein
VSVSERTRIVNWQDPAPVGKEAFSMADVAFLRAIAERKLAPPPIANLMGFDIEEVGEGRVVFGVEAQSTTTTRSAWSMADSRRRCSTRRWGAPSIRSCPKGARTRPWSSR